MRQDTRESRLEMNARRYSVVIEQTSTGYPADSPQARLSDFRGAVLSEYAGQQADGFDQCQPHGRAEDHGRQQGSGGKMQYFSGFGMGHEQLLDDLSIKIGRVLQVYVKVGFGGLLRCEMRSGQAES